MIPTLVDRTRLLANIATALAGVPPSVTDPSNLIIGVVKKFSPNGSLITIVETRPEDRYALALIEVDAGSIITTGAVT